MQHALDWAFLLDVNFRRISLLGVNKPAYKLTVCKGLYIPDAPCMVYLPTFTLPETNIAPKNVGFQ